MKLFKNRGKELVRDKACVEIEEFSQKILNKVNYGFDTMMERDTYKEKCLTQDIKLKDLQAQNEILKAQNEKLYAYLEKIAKIIKTDKKELLEEIADLKSDRYLKIELKPDKSKSNQKIGTKSSARSSKRSAIAKKMADSTEQITDSSERVVNESK